MLNFIPSQKHSLLYQLVLELCEEQEIICGQRNLDYLNQNIQEMNLILPIFDYNQQIIPSHFDFIIENKLHIHDIIEKEFNLSLLSIDPNPEVVWLDYMSHFIINPKIEASKIKICHNLFEACKQATQNPKHGLICHQNFIEQLDLPMQKLYSSHKTQLFIVNAKAPKNIKDETHLILNYDQKRNFNLSHLLHPFYNQNIQIENFWHRPHKSQIYIKLKSHFTQNKIRKAIYHYEKDLQNGPIDILGHNTA